MRKVDGSVIIDVDADLKKFQQKLQTLTSVAAKGLVAFNAAAGVAIGFAIKSGIEFESAFAGVRKTVSATEGEFKALEKAILDMSTKIPATAAEIAGVTEAAGQLGIKNENLLEFTRTMVDLGVATNLSGEAAATTLARLANITGMSQDKFSNLGSAIVALGNNLATTEAEIADMALGIAGAGSQVGMSESQILALSGALSSVGIEAQAGGTAISTLIINMKKATIEGGKKLSEFAKAANMTAKDFKQAFEKDAAGAIQKFIEGLATAEARGSNAFSLLADAGINESRMIRAMTGLSGASGILADAFKLSSDAWEENTALAKEASERYETTESKLKILQNSLANTGIIAFEKFKTPFKNAIDVGIEGLADLNAELSSGNLGIKVDKIARGFTNLTATLLDGAIKALPLFIDGMTWLVDNGEKAVKILVSLGAGYTTVKTVDGIMKISKAWGIATTAIKIHDQANRLQLLATFGGLSKTEMAVGALTGKIKMMTLAQAAFKALISPAGMALAIGAITALTVGYVLLHNEMDKTGQRIKETKKALDSAREATEELTKKSVEHFTESLKELETAEKYTAQLVAMQDESGRLVGSKEEIEQKINDLNGALGESMYWYDAETGKIMSSKGAVEDLTKEIQNLIDVKKGQAWLDANMDLYTEKLKQQAELTQVNADNFKRYKDIVSSSVGEASLKMYELEKAFSEGKIPQAEYIEQWNKLNSVGKDVSSNAIELAGIMGALGATSEQIAANEEFIKTFDTMGEAVKNIDTSTIDKITSGITVANLEGMNGLAKSLQDIKTAGEDLALFNEQKAMGLTVPESMYSDTVSKIENLKALITDMTGIDYDESFGKFGADAFDAYISALETKAQSEQDKVNTAVTNSFSGVEQTTVTESEKAAESGANALSNKYGNILDVEMPKEARQSLDIMGGAVDNWISGYRPKPIYIELKLKYDEELKKYLPNLGGATFDGSDSSSSIQPDFGSMIAKTKKTISNLSAKVSTVVLGTNEGQAPGGNKHIEISQIYNFNVPVNRPSEVTRNIEKTTKDLAKEI